jgi:hypothetical protein
VRSAFKETSKEKEICAPASTLLERSMSRSSRELKRVIARGMWPPESRHRLRRDVKVMTYLKLLLPRGSGISEARFFTSSPGPSWEAQIISPEGMVGCMFHAANALGSGRHGWCSESFTGRNLVLASCLLDLQLGGGSVVTAAVLLH